MNSRHADWDPRSDSVLHDQNAAYDELRRRCPVAYSEALQWSVFKHRDVLQVLSDPATFSSQTSERRAVPNGMDPPEHTAYRRALEPYFSPDRMRDFEPTCREAGAVLLDPLTERARVQAVECMGEYAVPFAVKCQCLFLGWPASMEAKLREWMRKNQVATLAGHRTDLAAIADEFKAHVQSLLRSRRESGIDDHTDVTAQLMRTKVNGALLTDDELTSILRNWTAGEVGSLASAIGIVLHHLANDQQLQQRVRQQPALLPAAIEEILRVSGPLVLNKRVATRDVKLGGRAIAKGERVTVMWVSANRDDEAFEHPTQVRLDRDPAHNLLYGAGIHVCPGAPLARLELRVAIDAVLQRCRHLHLGDARPSKAVFPANGYTELPLRFE